MSNEAEQFNEPQFTVRQNGHELTGTREYLVEQQVPETDITAAEQRHADVMAKHKVRHTIYRDVADLDSLLGKTANFTAGLARVQLDIMSKLATAHTMEDVRAAVADHIPLMTALQEKIDTGEIMSVQSAQGQSDQEAIFEGLEALTKVARIFEQQQPVAEATG